MKTTKIERRTRRVFLLHRLLSLASALSARLRFGSFFLWSAAAGIAGMSLQAEEAAGEEQVRPASEYAGWTELAADVELTKRFLEARAFLKEEKWEKGLELLIEMLSAEAAGSQGEKHDATQRRLVSEDDILFLTIERAVARRVGELPQSGKAVWERLLEESERKVPEVRPTASESPPAPASVPGEPTDWHSVLGRYDHAALDIPSTSEARLGGYVKWLYRFENFRELKSSQPARNPYYRYYQPQVVTLGDLVFARSHQDVVALDRESGEVRWHVVSDQPVEMQTHSSSSGFSSWRYFTDIGGWSLSLVAGSGREQVVVVDLSGRPTRSSGTLDYKYRSRLCSYDAHTGARLWTLGGESAEEELLRELSFAAPPSPLREGEGGETVLVAPLASRNAYYLAGMTTDGRLRWLEKVYDLAVGQADAQDGIYRSGLAHGAALAARGGVCVASPGHGVVAAVTASGEVLWWSRYRSNIRAKREEPTFAPGHPVISGSTVVVAPFDSDYLTAFDLETGRTLWDKQVSPGYFLFLGVDGNHCFTLDASGSVTAFSLPDGELAWKSEPTGTPAGRGLVTAQRIYVATQKKLVVLESETGRLLEKSEIWDSSVPSPVPGNLFLSRAVLFLAAPWGVARLEDYDATLARLNEFPLREQRLLRGRILRRRGEYLEALEELQKVLRKSVSEDERRTLRVELLELTQEAAAKTRDVEVIHRILENPDLVLTKAERTAFLLRTAESLREAAPRSAATTCRKLVDEASSGILAVSPDGFLVNPGLYASDCLRELVEAGRIPPHDPDEDRVARWVRAASVEKADPARAAEIMLTRSHVLAAAGAHAFLARWAAERGDFAAADQYLLRLETDYPQLGRLDEVRRTTEAWRRQSRNTPSSRPGRRLELPAERPWTLQFDHRGRAGDLVMTAMGSDPLPGVLVLDEGVLKLFDADGDLASATKLDGFPDLKEPRSKLESKLLEPCVAYADSSRGQVLLSTPVGLYELLKLGEGEPQVRQWFRETHPLARRWNETGGADTRRQVVQYSARGVNIVSTVERFGKIEGERSFYTEVGFTPGGDPVLLQPGGTVRVFEARTGRVRYLAESDVDAVSGLEDGPDSIFVVATVEPPRLVIHDLAQASRVSVPAPASPWRWALVPGIAVVLDTPVGIEVRQMTPSRQDTAEEEKPHYALWRDAEPRGQPSLVYADARQIIAVESGGHLVARELRSGRSRWTRPFPADVVPLRVYRIDAAAAGAGDLVIVGARQVTPWDGNGILGERAAEDLFVVRVSLDGGERWTEQLTAGKVSVDGQRFLVGSGWGFAYNHQEEETWKTRVVVLDPASGGVKTLIEHELPAATLYPPPRVLLTTEGIAVGNLGTWAWYSPRPPKTNRGDAEDAEAGSTEENTDSGKGSDQETSHRMAEEQPETGKRVEHQHEREDM